MGAPNVISLFLRNHLLNWGSIHGVYDAFPTPWGTQMWVQIENNERAKNQGMLLGSQHFRGVEGHARASGWD